MAGSSSTHYQTLGVPPGISQEELKARYLGLARVNHPDAGGDVAAFAALAEAWGVLGHPASRAAYDKELRFTRVPCPRCDGRGLTSKFSNASQEFRAKCRTCDGVGFQPPVQKGGI